MHTSRSLSGCCCWLPFLAFLLLRPVAGRAQGYAEGAALSYELTPLRFAGDDSPDFRADVYRANVIAPFRLGSDSTQSLLAGVSLEALHFGGSHPGLAVGNVYGLSPLLGYRCRVSPRVELTALALPALNSDLRQVRGADVTWGGVGRLAYRPGPRRAYRLTLGYRQQFYGPQYVLLLGLDWQLGRRWRAFGDLPTTFTLSYACTPRLNAGFTLLGVNTAYRLQDQNQYFQFQQGHYGLFAEAYLGTHWVVRATAAYAVTRRLEVYAENDQRPLTIDYVGFGAVPTPLSPRLEKGGLLRVALSYRVPTP